VHREAFTSPADAARLDDFAPATVVRPDGSRLRWTPESGTLLEALEADGARIPFSCRAGSCGTCAIRVDDPGASAAVQDETAQPGPGRILACARVPLGSLTVLSED
jgi:ferredoxin